MLPELIPERGVCSLVVSLITQILYCSPAARMALLGEAIGSR